MSDKRIQKVFYFSSKNTKSIVEGLLEDESIVTNRSASYLIEQHILNDFLPQNKTVSSWIQLLYMKDEKDKSISGLKDTMISVFSYLAAGIYFEAKINTGKKLVEYAYKNNCLYKNQSNDYNNENLNYFKSQLGYVIERIVMMQKAIKEETLEEAERKAKLIFDIEELRKIHKEDEIYNDSLSIVYMIILDNWDMLYNWTYTFRLLTAMARLQNWKDSAETRMILIKVLNEFANCIEN